MSTEPGMPSDHPEPRPVWHWMEGETHCLGIIAELADREDHQVTLYIDQGDELDGLYYLMHDRYDPLKVRWIHADKLERYFGDATFTAENESRLTELSSLGDPRWLDDQDASEYRKLSEKRAAYLSAGGVIQ